MNSYWVYILCSKRNRTLYIGVTRDLVRRVYEHKQKSIEGFTAQYNVGKLVHVEEFNDVYEAIHREKCIKKWNHAWKIRLVEKFNPQWEDLYDSMFSSGFPPSREWQKSTLITKKLSINMVKQK